MRSKQHTPHRRARAVACLAVAVLVCLSAQHAATGQRRPPPLQRPAPTAAARRALVVSLDGLDARYLTRADEYGLKIPTLRRLMSEGLTADDGVVGVYPTVTYPSHTTLVTGARPARHAVYGNEVFDPPPMPQTHRWYWFAAAVRADTLWAAAARARLSTGLVSWPVSAGAGDWNVPEIWKGGTHPWEMFSLTLAEMKRVERPRGLITEVERRDPALYRELTKDEGDDMRTRFAEYVMAEKRPRLVLVHLFDLDHFQHDHGPFRKEAFALMEKSDAYLARLLAAARRAGTLDETAVFVVSDHGFLPVERQLHPNVLLARAGLLQFREEKGADGRPRQVVTDWRVIAQPMGGSCAIYLRDPRDREALRLARQAFRPYGTAERSPSSRAADDRGRTRDGRATPELLRVVERAELRRLGANPRAALYLEGMNGSGFGGNVAGEPVTPYVGRGNHGFLPTRDGYRSSFVASGAGVTRRGRLGTIRMTSIGPTIARHLGLALRDAESPPLRLR